MFLLLGTKTPWSYLPMCSKPSPVPEYPSTMNPRVLRIQVLEKKLLLIPN
jgi:hypothetical protein